MDNQNIASITNNGGIYSGSTIDKAIDGDFNIHWETGRENSSEFTNEVEIDFKEAGWLFDFSMIFNYKFKIANSIKITYKVI